MSIHPPKHISSKEGLGLNTTKYMEQVNDTLAFGTEVWNELEIPWKQDDIVIALPGYTWRTRWEVGKPYIINKFLNESDQLIGIYCDICRPVEKIGNGYAFDDLYLDVWQVPGRDPVILDEDELEAAVAAGYVSQRESETTRNYAHEVIKLLKANPELLDF